MKTITAITPQVKNAKRCNIYLDGEFFCGMSLEIVVKNRLKVGEQIDGERIERIQLDGEKDSALDRAMSFLSSAVKSEKQTRDYLREKGYTPLVIRYVVDKLTEYGFLNDGDYAKRYVETYADRKGALLLKRELRGKGLKDEDVEAALEDLGSQEEAAEKAARKYMRGKEADPKTVQKLYRHLLSKGFTYDDARSAVRQVCAADDD